jgi:hypothetical protein
MNLEEIVTRVGRRHFHEVQPNRAPTARGDGQGVTRDPRGVPACSALTLWQVGQVRMNVSTSVARAGHHTVRRAKDNALSLPKCPRRGAYGSVKVREDQPPNLRRCVIRNAKAIPP